MVCGFVVNEMFFGEVGDDLLDGCGGNDIFDGGVGNDEIFLGGGVLDIVLVLFGDDLINVIGIIKSVFDYSGFLSDNILVVILGDMMLIIDKGLFGVDMIFGFEIFDMVLDSLFFKLGVGDDDFVNNLILVVDMIVDGGVSWDVIVIGFGDDIIIGGLGFDDLNGGVGFDIVVYLGNCDDYDISGLFLEIIIVDLREGFFDGIDIV